MIDDATLLQRYAHSRDAGAFSELVRRYAGLVYSVCLRVTNDPHDAEDIAQDCFFALARKADEITSSLPAWLHSVATNRSIDAIRRQSTRKSSEESAMRNGCNCESPAWEEIAPHVDAALIELPEELRIPLVLHYMKGRSQGDIAAELGLNQSTISRRIDKGVVKLRSKLGRAGVIVPAVLLTALLTENAVAAVPATLTAALGKIAMAGVGKTAAGASAVAAGGKVIAGGGLSMIAKMTMATVISAALITVGVVSMNGKAAPPAGTPPAEAVSKPAEVWGPVSNGLQCRLLPLTQTVEVAEGTEPRKIVAEVTFEIRNVSEKSVKFLPHYTLLEGLAGDILDVIGPDGQRVAYKGVHAERHVPRSEDFLTLAPQQTHSHCTNVAGAYYMSKPGAYRITFAQTRMQTSGREFYYGNDAEKMKQNPDNVWAGQLKSNTVTINIIRPKTGDRANDLQTISGMADRIVVAEGQGRRGQYNLAVMKTLKGSTSSATNQSIRRGNATDNWPDKGKPYIFFLQVDGHGRQVPLLSPASPTGWFMEYSEEREKQVRAAIPLPAKWGEENGSLRMGLRVRKKAFSPGEDIPVEICIQNVGREPVSLPQHRYNIYDYYLRTGFRITTPDKATWELAKPAGAIREADTPSAWSLDPGESYIHTVRLNKWPLSRNFENRDIQPPSDIFGIPGDYTIACHYTNIVMESRPPSPGQFAGTLISNPITITIKPPAEADNAFALDMYRQLRSSEGNLFYSPYSISTALAMTYAGARGETEKQMAKALHFDVPQEEVHRAFKNLIAELQADKEERGYELSVANALWGQDGYNFLDSFLETTREYYGAGLRQVDFIGKTEEARQTINKWVEVQTKDKIKELLKQGMLDPMTRLVLTNAIYFKGKWAKPFDKKYTKDRPFTLLNGNKINVPMMLQSSRFRYAETEAVAASPADEGGGLTVPLKVLEMPYAGDELSMVILLPGAVKELGTLERFLSPNSLNKWLGALQEQKVSVILPRFKITDEFRLEKVLSVMGMPDAFAGGKADFSGMNGTRELFIGAVVHKAFVDVNEEGTEAAAATAVVMKLGIAPRPETFNADHPFLFLIRHRKTNAILFIGRVMNPSDDPVSKKEPTVIKTPEIVRILEEERIAFISTTHAQSIRIRLEDGSRYEGQYVHKEAGKYAANPKLFDILNLVIHIKEKRPAEEVKGWQMLMQ